MFKHLYNYLVGINFISVHQSGFQPGDSTSNQLGYIYHEIADALDKKKMSILYFVILQRLLIGFGTKVSFINYRLLEFVAYF